MRLLRYVAKRLLIAAPQILGVTMVTFLIVRLLPGNPAYQLAGPFATESTLSAMEARLGLDRPLPEQYWQYLKNLSVGDWGDSWFTTRPVSEELLARLPATLELISAAMLIIGLGGLLIGLVVALRGGGLADRLTSAYGLMSGSFPDFWLALVLSYIFFFVLGWLPGPSGRLPASVTAPPTVSGFLTIDALLSGSFSTLWAALKQMILPVLTLVIVYMGGIVKLARTSLMDVLRGDMVAFARMSGLRETTVIRYALKNALPPVLTLMGITYAFLLGGAVLVESVYSWGGAGQYVVDSIGRSDYFPVQAFVLVAALLNVFVYLVIDIVHLFLDPRVEF